jgi:hypothetical protein
MKSPPADDTHVRPIGAANPADAAPCFDRRHT